MNTTTLNKTKRIAVVANDNKKLDLINLAYFNKKVLMQHEFVATGNAGNILEGTLNKPVKKLMSSQFGGNQQLAALMAEGELDVLIYFGDPLETQKHDSGITNLLKKALTHNVVVACNRQTADFV